MRARALAKRRAAHAAAAAPSPAPPSQQNTHTQKQIGALTATFVCPLDVLKTRLQVQRIGAGGVGARRPGIAGGLADIARAEGLGGLYRGLTPTLLALLPNWAVYFTVYGRLKTTLTTSSTGACGWW
jgi:solute carrier family 25 folate transporter 32